MTDASADGRKERVKKAVGKLDRLPTLPTMMLQMNKMMMDPDTTAKDIATLIGSDPSITARILKVVNSPFYGFTSRIATISHAIVILGFNTVRSITLSSTLVGTFGKGDAKFKREDFWRHSVACGAACKVLARHAGDVALEEEYFITGLLHDVGKIIEDQFMHDDFLKIRQEVENKKILFLEAEEALLGINHAEIGGALFEQWQLTPGIVNAVTNHHNPTAAGDHVRGAAIVHLGDIFARALMVGSGGDEQIPEIKKEAWEALNLRPDELPNLLRETDKEVARASVFLDFVA